MRQPRATQDEGEPHRLGLHRPVQPPPHARARKPRKGAGPPDLEDHEQHALLLAQRAGEP